MSDRYEPTRTFIDAQGREAWVFDISEWFYPWAESAWPESRISAITGCPSEIAHA
jgi:hypothetical protein